MIDFKPLVQRLVIDITEDVVIQGSQQDVFKRLKDCVVIKRTSVKLIDDVLCPNFIPCIGVNVEIIQVMEEKVFMINCISVAKLVLIAKMIMNLTAIAGSKKLVPNVYYPYLIVELILITVVTAIGFIYFQIDSEKRDDYIINAGQIKVIDSAEVIEVIKAVNEIYVFYVVIYTVWDRVARFIFDVVIGLIETR